MRGSTPTTSSGRLKKTVGAAEASSLLPGATTSVAEPPVAKGLSGPSDLPGTGDSSADS